MHLHRHALTDVVAELGRDFDPDTLRTLTARLEAVLEARLRSGAPSLPPGATLVTAALAREPGARAGLRRGLALLRGGGPCAFVGPSGSGRRDLLAWLDAAAGGRGVAEFDTWDGWSAIGAAGASVPLPVGPPPDVPDALTGDRSGGSAEEARRQTVLLSRVDEWEAGAQVALARAYGPRTGAARDAGTRDAVAPRVVLLLERRPEVALVPELAACITRRSFTVPPLEEVRHRVPALAAEFLAEAAHEAGLAAPRLAPEAEALLFRASWPGGISDVRRLCRSLAARGGVASGGRGLQGTELEAADVARVLREIGLAPPSRLPVGRPPVGSGGPGARGDDGDLLSALWATRTVGGRLNKTRAAQWMGWDRGTLANRAHQLTRGDGGGVVGRLVRRAEAWAKGRDPAAGCGTGP
jgi:hypothetical protein